MKINFKARLKNKVFWMTIVPAIILAVQAIAGLFGFTLDLTVLSGKLVACIDAVFGVLAILGIVVDPTTKGVEDSELAMTYAEPK